MKDLRKTRPHVEALEARVTAAAIVNGDFSISDPADPQFGYTLRGNATISGGQGILNEGSVVQSGIAQGFTIQPGATTLRFTIVAVNLTPNSGAAPPDAFEVALLDATTLQPLIGPPTGLSNTDAFLNVQQTGEVFFAPGVTVPGVATSGQAATFGTPFVVTVDISGVAAGTEATIQFDLIGFGLATSVVRIDDLVQQAPGEPLLSLNLDPATDSGAVGDDLTRFGTVNLVGNTDPNQQVSLDVEGDGFDDGVTTADATGLYRFDGVVLIEGANPLRVQATNAVGTTTASRTITVDTQAPMGTLVVPAPGSTVAQDAGFIEVQWTDPGAAGLDETTFGPADVTLSGVDVDEVANLGGGLVRYRYNLDGDTLPSGTVTVNLVGGEVSDRAGNTNPPLIQSFSLAPGANRAPLAGPDSHTVAEDGVLTIAAPGVLANDSDPDGDGLTAVLVAGPARGALVLNPDGSFTYSPAPGFSGADSFTYRASDGALVSDPTPVSITVTPVNAPPVARDDAYATTADTALTIAEPGVLANDSDPNGDGLTAVLVAGPARGALVLNPDGSFTYSPAPGFSGTDSFTYRASDGATTGSEATVLVTVTPCPAPARLLPDTPFFNHLRARRAVDPTRFDRHHPRVGPLLGLEVDGIPTAPTRLLPAEARFEALRTHRSLDPEQFDRRHPVLGALIRLETPGGAPSPAPFLPGLPRAEFVRARRVADPDRFDRHHPILSALIALESALACGPAAGTM